MRCQRRFKGNLSLHERALNHSHPQPNHAYVSLIDSILVTTVIAIKLSINRWWAVLSHGWAWLSTHSWISFTHLCQRRPRTAEMRRYYLHNGIKLTCKGHTAGNSSSVITLCCHQWGSERSPINQWAPSVQPDQVVHQHEGLVNHCWLRVVSAQLIEVEPLPDQDLVPIHQLHVKERLQSWCITAPKQGAVQAGALNVCFFNS